MIKYTELKSMDRKNLKEILPLSKPFTILVEPSSRCNFQCIQCFQNSKGDNYFTKNRRNMDFDTYLKVIDQLKNWDGLKIKVLKLCLYGEPLLNPDFCEMLKVAKEENIADRIETTTNASLLTKRIAEELVEYKLDYIRVSIYAPYQQKHEEITGTRFDIREIYENLKVLQEVKRHAGSEYPFVALKILDTYGRENDDFFKMYNSVADEIYIDKPHNWIVNGEDKFTDILYKNNSGQADKDIKDNENQRKACPMVFTTMAVRSNGDVSPCCIDFIGGTNLGNINDKTLKELWNSSQWREFMKMQLENRKQENFSCSRCDFYKSSYYIKDNIDDFDSRKLR